ncbi:penicillin-binding protein activator [Thalassotalea sp. ND16A]|uniref:penicillin-binding protein activator n=1 Tax=Thalassotalea sp. ND16A TaxID=1535422 RepID=UPI00051A3203|nr:penicillin-binding protein activator [Thalassotalea sp. ND16A]
MLFGCSTPTSDKKIAPPAAPTEQIEVIAPTQLSGDRLVAKAKNEENQQAIVFLLQAATQYIKEQQLAKALHISAQLRKLPLTLGQNNYNQLNIVQVLFESGEVELAAKQLLAIETSTPSKRHLFLLANIKVQQGLLVKGIISYLNYYQQFPFTDTEQVYYLNSLFAQLTPWQFKALEKSTATHLSGWLAFAKIVATYGHEPKDLTSNLSRWQRSFPAHPATVLVSGLNSKGIEFNDSRAIENISVLLPLSGREEPLGKAIQAGILAAYQLQNANTGKSRNIRFYDTNAKPMADIVAQLHLQQPDFVIGPLLKQHVDDYLLADGSALTVATAPAENNKVALMPKEHNWTTLLLNLPEHGNLTEQQFALSMLPEDEAKQAAFSLSQKGFNSAIILSQNTAIGKRMATSFAEQWQLQTEIKPSIIYYPSGKQMQTVVKKGLDVHLSDERIYLMRNRIKENLKAEARNRRDIDMIYMFATPDQARLLKPYIDVNISPFANAIPMYASSRSHNIDSNSNTRRDLNGLTFTEIPWLLNAQQVNQNLAVEAKQLWPGRSSQLERIYAMGIDSMQLVDKVDDMQLIPMLRHKGETGTLQMNANRIISRSFSWGKYRSSRVQSVNLD